MITFGLLETLNRVHRILVKTYLLGKCSGGGAEKSMYLGNTTRSSLVPKKMMVYQRS